MWLEITQKGSTNATDRSPTPREARSRRLSAPTHPSSRALGGSQTVSEWKERDEQKKTCRIMCLISRDSLHCITNALALVCVYMHEVLIRRDGAYILHTILASRLTTPPPSGQYPRLQVCVPPGIGLPVHAVLPQARFTAAASNTELHRRWYQCNRAEGRSHRWVDR